MRLDIGIEQVRGLLEDEKFVRRIAKRLLRNKDAKEELIEQVAAYLADAIDDDPDLRSKILLSTLDDSAFRGKVAGDLMEELIDG